ncbi:MAG: nucleotidyltransferase family protein, partial [Clostridia bacterium]|nr:nucleotidyltransferase family protein [Clostridia bacterium]
MKESVNLGIAGIVAEFNPFHNGHKYLIDCAKSDGHAVYTVISGNFVQRGDVAIISKFERAKQALLCGADIVCELPCPWSMSTAENFAFGAVSQLNSLGIEFLYFGSECGDSDLLVKTADVVSSEAFNNLVGEKLSSGKTFAAIRQEILSEIAPNSVKVLENPNDTLAVEYILAAKKINPSIRFKAIKRIGAGHNDLASRDNFSTATLIREKIKENDLDYIKQFVPPEAQYMILAGNISDIRNIESGVLAVLRTKTIEELRARPDISEGIENGLYNAIRHATTLDELYMSVKSKRYTLARIRRMVLSAFIGIDNSFFKKEPPYTRILGFRNN